MSIEAKLSKLGKYNNFSKPHLFELRYKNQCAQLDKLLKTSKIRHVVDDYEEQLHELFAVNNPSLVYTTDFHKYEEEYFREVKSKLPLWQQGVWVYFPWDSKIVHILVEKDFFQVRTARNMNLISHAEQLKFYNSCVGIAGLSVGSSVAIAIALQGGAKNFKLADMDRVALSNTNRILCGVENLGLNKVEMAARLIYNINPYSSIEVYDQGLSKKNMHLFFSGLDIVVDEIDNLSIKYLIREHAQKNQIAVVMAADNGDNAVVDIERYDIKKGTNFFHGRMGKVSYESLTKLDKFGIGKTITKHVGTENVTERMQNSLLEMGKTIVSWPQLGGAAMINGAAVAYCVRKVLNNLPLENNRALISLDEKMIPNFNSSQSIKQRANIAKKFREVFGL